MTSTESKRAARKAGQPRRGFHETAPALLDMGWLPFPLPEGHKSPPPNGLTGRRPEAIEAAKSHKSWRKAIRPYLSDESHAMSNTGIKLPPNIIALDIDEYDKVTGEGKIEKQGWKNLQVFAETHGISHPSALPKTVRLTSRGYRGVSGQRFFRLPEHLSDAEIEEINQRLPGQLVPDVELIRPWHRYTIEAGSLHDEGGVYALYDERSKSPRTPLPLGFATITPDELPELPEEWLEAILSISPSSTSVNGHGSLDGAPKSEAERSHAARLLDAWLDEHDDSDEDDPLDKSELLAILTPGARRALLAFDDPIRNNANVSAAAIALLARLIEDTQTKERHLLPLRDVINLARDLYTSHGDRRNRPREFDRALAWAFPIAKQAVDAQLDSSATLTWANEVIAEEFWNQTPVLRSAKQFARFRMVAPEAMLACALVIVASWLPPHLTLPPLVGGESSLNFYVALAGASGQGKSAAMAAAKEWLRVIPHEDTNLDTDEPVVTTIATGEGLLTAYTATRPKRKGALRPGQLEYIQHKRSVRFEVDEIESLGATMNRDSSTLRSFLKTMWTGSGISTTAAEAARTRKLDDHSFRATIVAGVQPATADVILSDHGGGFPQRWLWIETYDENPLTDEELDATLLDPPEPYEWEQPRAAYPLPMPDDDDDEDDPNKKLVNAFRNTRTVRNAALAEQPHEVLEVTASYRMKVREAARAGRKIGEAGVTMDEVLDGHRVHLEEKLAALIAALHGHIGITDEYERMAEWLAHRSDETRAAILKERAEEEARAMDSRAARQGRSEALAEDIRLQTSEERMVERVQKYIADHGGEIELPVLRRAVRLSVIGDKREQVDFLKTIPGLRLDGELVTLDERDLSIE